MAPPTRAARGTKADSQVKGNLPKNKQNKEGSNPRVSKEPRDADSGETNDVEIIEPTDKEPAPNEQAGKEGQGTLSLAEQLKRDQAKQKRLLQSKEQRMIKEKIERLRAENAQMEESEARPRKNSTCCGNRINPTTRRISRV